MLSRGGVSESAVEDAIDELGLGVSRPTAFNTFLGLLVDIVLATSADSLLRVIEYTRVVEGKVARLARRRTWKTR